MHEILRRFEIRSSGNWQTRQPLLPQSGLSCSEGPKPDPRSPAPGFAGTPDDEQKSDPGLWQPADQAAAIRHSPAYNAPKALNRILGALLPAPGFAGTPDN